VGGEEEGVAVWGEVCAFVGVCVEGKGGVG